MRTNAKMDAYALKAWCWQVLRWGENPPEADYEPGTVTPSFLKKVARLSIGEALRGSRLGEFWKYRIGDYRVSARVEDAAVCVLVVRIGNRRDVYR